jgi:hypothetical protein
MANEVEQPECDVVNSLRLATDNRTWGYWAYSANAMSLIVNGKTIRTIPVSGTAYFDLDVMRLFFDALGRPMTLEPDARGIVLRRGETVVGRFREAECYMKGGTVVRIGGTGQSSDSSDGGVIFPGSLVSCGSRLAWMERGGDSTVIMLDGQRIGPAISEAKTVALYSLAPAFSSDCQGLAFFGATEEEKAFVWSRRGIRYVGSVAYAPILSRDGTRVAYGVKTVDSDSKARIHYVVNERELPAFDNAYWGQFCGSAEFCFVGVENEARALVLSNGDRFPCNQVLAVSRLGWSGAPWYCVEREGVIYRVEVRSEPR